MILARGTMLLVVDGSKMLLLRNDGDSVKPDMVVIEQRSVDILMNRDLLTDAPSVTYSSAGYGRDTTDKSDPHQRKEDQFVAEAADILTQYAKDSSGDLIVAAPPAALHILRNRFGPVVKDRLIAELAKDFSNHPVDEITRLILAH